MSPRTTQDCVGEDIIGDAPFGWGWAISAYTKSVEIEGSEHLVLSSTGGEGGGAGGREE